METTFGEVETSAYVVDDEYRLVYFNKRLAQRFPDIIKGSHCYRSLRSEVTPCADCPLRIGSDHKTLSYNQVVRRWVETEVSDIEWPGEGSCKILLCREVDAPELGAPMLEPYDKLTGLRTRMAFFGAVAELLSEQAGQPYCLMAVDIEHFKLFNEWYGEEAGDRFLGDLGAVLGSAADEHGGIAGYLLGDDFCIMLPQVPSVIDALQERLVEHARRHGENVGFLPAFGLYAIDDVSLPVSTMYDRALLALASIKGDYAHRSKWYDDGMLQEMEDDHSLLLEVQRALEKNEFSYYVQPKCSLATGKIVGMEALVRWKHPERGLISPGLFVPMLERNGLITKLDLHIWEQVCQGIRSWLDAGNVAVPVSVNVSRRDPYAIDVPDTLVRLTRKYDIDPALLAIEITESSYVEDYQMISGMIDRLRAAGFTVLMDDFGSGYSSLSMLKDMNVDVLKLDMKLLDMADAGHRKGRSILESIIGMARLVDLRIIAEGVETEEQRALLSHLGCLYAQGYYFYKPMPPDELGKLLVDRRNVDFRGIQGDPIEQLQVRQLLNENVLSEAMLDDMLGALAVYDVCDGKVELLSANERYCRLTGINPIDLQERRSEFAHEVYEADWPAFIEAFDRAFRNAPNEASVDVRRMKASGDTVHMNLRAFFLRERDGHRLYFGILRDVTEQRQQAQQLASSQRALSAVAGVSAPDSSFMSLAEENRRAASAIFAQMSPGGMIGGYCEDGFPLYFANAAMVELLGYGSFDELAEAIDWRVANTIHPEDASRVAADIGPAYYAGLEYTTTYRMPKKDGTWFWTLDKGRVVEAEDGRLAIVSACTDITEVMAVQQQLTERNKLLLSQNRELTFLNHDMPGGYHRCLDAPDFDFLHMSDRFLDQFGYTRAEIKELYDDKFMRMVHPDDRDLVRQGVAAMRAGEASSAPLEYRMKSKHGYLWVVDQSRFLEYEGVSFLQGVIVDVTETVELRNMMSLLIEHLPNDIVMLSWTDRDHIRVEVVAYGFSSKYGCEGTAYEQVIYQHLYNEGSIPGRRLADEIADAIEQGSGTTVLIPVAFPGASDVWVYIETQSIGKEPGKHEALCICADVSTIKRQQQELWIARRKLEGILRQAGVNSWDWDIVNDRLEIARSEAAERVLSPFAQSAGDTLVVDDVAGGNSLLRFIPPEHHNAFEAFVGRIQAAGDHEQSSCEVPFEVGDGSFVWLEMKCETVRDGSGALMRVVGYYADVTDRVNEHLRSAANTEALERLREQRKQLVKMAETDALTGLYNRQTAIPKIEERLASLHEEAQGGASLIMLDMDAFKQANDVFGHAFGDEVLTNASAALRASFPGAVVCRMGGDEFLVWCEGVAEQRLEYALENVLRAMEFARKLEGRDFLFTVSAGYVMAPQDGTEFDDLYQKADAALFAAKMKGKRRFARYEPGMKGFRPELA